MEISQKVALKVTVELYDCMLGFFFSLLNNIKTVIQSYSSFWRKNSMNANQINKSFDLLALVPNLKKAGAYHVGACPFCGGRDRFTIKHTPEGDRWHCRNCSNEKYYDVFNFIMRRDSCNFKTALQSLDGEVTPAAPRIVQLPPVQLPDNPPSETWQAQAWKLIEKAKDCLWSEKGKDALAWLLLRGLSETTIAAHDIGYIPIDFINGSKAWGTPRDDPRPMFFYEGILIPCIIGQTVWYLKMRPSNPRDGQKYKHVRGGKQALYLVDFLSDDQPAIFCEGELDALLLLQEVRALASVITLASSTSPLNLASWGIYLLRPTGFILAHDTDEAGEKAAQNLSWLHDSRRLKIPALRAGDKDITDFYLSGGNLRELIQGAITQ
jgi:hypothetical protein